ncbi:MAG: hypothetical protein WDO19_29125 [Bacteroidota bacterium]
MIALPIKITVFLLAIFIFYTGWCMPVSAGEIYDKTSAADSIPFNQWVKEAEKAGKYRFYYDTALVGHYKIPDDAGTKDINSMLQNFFDQSAYHFVVDRGLNVFITEKIHPLPSSVSSSFFDKNKIDINTRGYDCNGRTQKKYGNNKCGGKQDI